MKRTLTTGLCIAALLVTPYRARPQTPYVFIAFVGAVLVVGGVAVYLHFTSSSPPPLLARSIPATVKVWEQEQDGTWSLNQRIDLASGPVVSTNAWLLTTIPVPLDQLNTRKFQQYRIEIINWTNGPPPDFSVVLHQPWRLPPAPGALSSLMTPEYEPIALWPKDQVWPEALTQ